VTRGLPRSSAKACAFCRIVRGDAPARVVLDTEGVIAFFPLKPAVIGHVLVVPKAHIETVWELDSDTAHQLADASLLVSHALRRALRPEGLNLIQSNGEAATQTIDHLHVHVLPRWTADPIDDFWPDVSPWSEKELDRARDVIAERM